MINSRQAAVGPDHHDVPSSWFSSPGHGTGTRSGAPPAPSAPRSRRSLQKSRAHVTLSRFRRRHRGRGHGAGATAGTGEAAATPGGPPAGRTGSPAVRLTRQSRTHAPARCAARDPCGTWTRPLLGTRGRRPPAARGVARRLRGAPPADCAGRESPLRRAGCYSRRDRQVAGEIRQTACPTGWCRR